MADPHGIHKAPSASKRVPAGVPRIRKESIRPEFFCRLKIGAIFWRQEIRRESPGKTRQTARKPDAPERRSAAHRHLFHPPGAKQMTGCFLLPRPMARRPTLTGRSAARGISTGVTSRGTPGRAFQGGQPVVSQIEGRVEIAVHLQPARLAPEGPLGKGERRTDPAAARAPLRGREVPRRHNEMGAIPGALILQHPPEGPPPRIQNGPGKTPVPRQAPHVQVLHHQNRLGFRQLRGDLVQEVPADVPNPAVQPGQTQDTAFS
jgi:hypothetical protein